MVDVETGAVADAKAVDWVILDVDIVNRTRSQNLGEFDEVIGPERLSV